MKKDKTLIPEGMYCYSGEHRCPYRTTIEVGHNNTVLIPYCTYLEEGDVTALNKKEYKILRSYHNCSNEELWKKYPLDLLWDSVKECGVNEDET